MHIENKIPTAMCMFSGMTFSTAIMFTLPGVAVTLEINIADKKRKYTMSQKNDNDVAHYNFNAH